MPTQCDRLTPEELAQIPLFAEDDRAALQWLADHFQVVCYESGEVIVQVHGSAPFQINYVNPADDPSKK